mmetsp:Transcript_22928/g.33753  ORF Transcript_22928/g.33753 Transcript_22928/m.33753 type:complete len:140 (+) Transcript_22928:116-535(+)
MSLPVALNMYMSLLYVDNNETLPPYMYKIILFNISYIVNFPPSLESRIYCVFLSFFDFYKPTKLKIRFTAKNVLVPTRPSALNDNTIKLTSPPGTIRGVVTLFLPPLTNFRRNTNEHNAGLNPYSNVVGYAPANEINGK